MKNVVNLLFLRKYEFINLFVYVKKGSMYTRSHAKLFRMLGINR